MRRGEMSFGEIVLWGIVLLLFSTAVVCSVMEW